MSREKGGQSELSPGISRQGEPAAHVPWHCRRMTSAAGLVATFRSCRPAREARTDDHPCLLFLGTGVVVKKVFGG